ncbi:MAG: tetratricopeptide repeat protein [Muribaculaceae bacterium]|nr:tetratricopeptide repeat protein [Muribaculaceae bacterium]
MKRLLFALLTIPVLAYAQINTDQVLRIGQNNLYFEDYVLSIQYFNRVIDVKPYLAQPYFYRAVAKLNLDDYIGAEQDATLALDRNPFIVDAWEVRGVARQNMGKNRDAIADYNQALSMMPDSRGLLYNKAIAQQDVKDLAGADSTYAFLLKRFPGFDGGYLGRARLRLEQKDTIGAKEDIDKALSINRNAVNAYVMRADIAINSHSDYASALADMDKAIRLQPKYAGFFINRAFLRYMTDDFQGAFADYDYALQLEPQNTMAMFNRGLLRTEVHDTDKAITDFTRVLQLDPNDYKALYNRAILLSETGRLDRAIADMDKLIEEYPDFAAAYFMRYDAKRRKGDLKGAEKDYDKSLQLAKTKVQLDPQGRFSVVSTDSVAAGDSDDLAMQAPVETQEQVKRRFSSLNTIVDNTRPEQIFNSKEIRGKVQDRNISIELEPIFSITYYTSPTELKMSGEYMREVDDINSTRTLRFLLQVTNHEPSTTDEETAQRHFESVAYYNSYLAGHSPRSIDYLGRAMDFMTLRDYENAIADLGRAISLTPDFTLAYLIRANAEFLLSQTPRPHATTDGTEAVRHELPGGPGAIRSALADLDKVIELSPLMPIAHYNKGVIQATEGDYTSALMSFSRAIELKPDFGEAYYNRGYVYLTLGNKEAAFSDLSKAGSLGIVPSYNLLKRMSAK